MMEPGTVAKRTVTGDVAIVHRKTLLLSQAAIAASGRVRYLHKAGHRQLSAKHP